ncbi:MAG: AbgT family transporter [Lachnospiraceae bacterium]|jgi:aminobenzoyl-glutamate transport protein|nr:AbgT family transporter [Lachnospiraceae bacterium]
MSEKKAKRSPLESFLHGVEVMGNKIPNPMLLFIYLCIAVIAVSAVCSIFHVSAINPVNDELVEVVNLFTKAGFVKMLTTFVTNFTGTSALGLTLTCMLGVGVAEASGLFHTALRGLSRAKGSDFKVIAIFTFVCVMADCTGGAGFVVMPPLGALIWAAMGRNPMAGMLAAYASVAGAFASNLMITSMDVVNMGYTQAAAELLLPEIELSPSMNWYFSVVSTIFLTIVSTWITVKIVEPRMGVYTGDYRERAEEPTGLDNKGLKAALISLLAYAAVIMLLCANGVLADETGSLLNSAAPLMKGMTVLIALMFAIPGIAFGYASGRFKKFDDVAAAMTQAMGSMANYIALFYFIAQFLKYFDWSNLGLILAIKGANALKASGLPIWVLLIIFVIMCCFLNLLIGSASTKWSILSSIFVPMFMLMGYSPALIQMAYRIGDAVTNPICPTFAYFGMLLALAQKYDKKAGFGTLMSNMMPYVIAYFIFMVAELLIWFFFNLPLGPNSYALFSM